jgi:hypothetical protein
MPNTIHYHWVDYDCDLVQKVPESSFDILSPGLRGALLLMNSFLLDCAAHSARYPPHDNSFSPPPEGIRAQTSDA